MLQAGRITTTVSRTTPEVVVSLGHLTPDALGDVREHGVS
jgi:hypothetical protein